ncbi:type II toxin-antitoxin system RelB family antitoxin [Verminephrobacter aporrectodeae]|uniref:type II toxin-antitoxin system RelB family antitoxin n=1 Tax=Verminephrobacter aporrectodeae TaxID=1110389 RepID=UPI0002375E36
MLAIRLPAEVETRLEALAQATGRTKTFYAREAILEHLDDIEDWYLAERRLIDIRAENPNRATRRSDETPWCGIQPNTHLRACCGPYQEIRSLQLGAGALEFAVYA